MKKICTLLPTIALLSAILGCGSKSGGSDDPVPSQPTIEISSTQSEPSFDNSGGSATMSFTTSSTWVATVNDTKSSTWCSISPTGGTSGSNTITITAAKNTETSDRKATVTITSGTTSKSFSVSQKAGPQGPNITMNEGYTDPSFESTASSITISFTTTVAWTAALDDSDAASWCSISPTSGSAGSSNIQITVKANSSSNDRSTTATIKADTASKQFTISQKGRSTSGTIYDMDNKDW